MNRATAAAKIGLRWPAQLTDAGLTATDTSANISEPIDDALRLLGYGEADLATADVPVEDVPDYLAALAYTTLSLVLARLADRFDLTTGGKSLRLQQSFANTERLLARAASDVLARFGSLTGGARDGVIGLDLNYLSPGPLDDRVWV